jgi:hypothetical protein
MGRKAFLVGVAVWLAGLTGCVERRFVVSTDPPGALVLRNNNPIGFAPADDHFVYYGTYDFTLIKDGYATLHVHQKIPRPWYEYFPLEIFSEIFWPFRIEDVRHFNYHLEPLPGVRPDELLNHAQVLRNRGKTLGPGTPPAPTAITSTPTVPPPTTPPALPPATTPVAAGGGQQ